jgi:signal transduction histidine kinase
MGRAGAARFANDALNGTMNDFATEADRNRPQLWIALTVCAAMVGLTAWIRLGIFGHTRSPVGFGVPIVFAGWARRRWILWTMVAIFVGITLGKLTFMTPNPPIPRSERLMGATLLMADLFVVAGIVHMLVRRGDQVDQNTIALRKLNDELDYRRREAEESSARKTRFLAAVSHDIRTPANAISLLSEVVQQCANDPKQVGDIPELASELHKSSMSLVALISDVLDLTRMDAGRIELRETEFEFNAWLEEECHKLQPLAEKKNLAFNVATAPHAVQIRADRVKLSRVVTNLIGNAIKYTHGGSVRVETTINRSGNLQMKVSDTGIGIAPDGLSSIFDEFSQIRSPNRENSSGSGLGLSICKRLAVAMGGTLSVESVLGKGSTFTLTLPAAMIVATPEVQPA